MDRRAHQEAGHRGSHLPPGVRRPAFLIYGTGIRNLRNSLKIKDANVSNLR